MGLVVGAALGLALASSAGAFIYWATRYDAIGRANLDGSGVDPSFINPVPVGTGGPYVPTDVAVDGTHIYWTANLDNNKGGEEYVVGRAGLGGATVEPMFLTTAPFPEGVAVDDKHIYWASDALVAGTSTIGRSSLDGSGVNQSFVAGLGRPCGVALDSGHVYWDDGNEIGRANLDGTGVDEDFITLNAYNGACGVAVDGEYIYWAETATGAIGRANLNGSGINESFITGANSPCGVAVDGAHVYWATDGGGGDIGRANLDGSGVNQSFIYVTGAFMCGIAVDALLPTTTTIESAKNSITYGESDTFTATVRNTPSSDPIAATGAVQFKVDGSDEGSPVALDADGQASYTPTVPVGVGEAVTAGYTGNTQLGASTSEGAELTIQPAPTETTLTASQNPANAGADVEFTATVANAATSVVPSGEIEFEIDGEPLSETLPLEEGQAGIEVGGLQPGNHTVLAHYTEFTTLGMPDFAFSHASLIEHIANPAPPATVRPSPAPAPAPAPNSNFELIRSIIASNGTIILSENAPEQGKFTATAKTRSAYISRVNSISVACAYTNKHKCKPPGPAVYGTTSQTADTAGVVKLIIGPNHSARAALAHGRTLHLIVYVTFQPTRGGAPKTTTTPETAKREETKRHRHT